MKNVLFMAAFVVICAVAQTTLAPSILDSLSHTLGWTFLHGHTVDFVLLSLLYLSFHRDTSGAILWAYFLSAVNAWFGRSWPGATALSFLTVAFIGSQIQNAVLMKGPGGAAMLAFVGTLLEGAIHLKGGEWFAKIPNAFHGQVSFLFVQAILNAAAAVLVQPALRFLDGWSRADEGFGGRHIFLPELK